MKNLIEESENASLSLSRTRAPAIDVILYDIYGARCPRCSLLPLVFREEMHASGLKNNNGILQVLLNTFTYTKVLLNTFTYMKHFIGELLRMKIFVENYCTLSSCLMCARILEFI